MLLKVCVIDPKSSKPPSAGAQTLWRRVKQHCPLLVLSYTIRWLQENIHRQKCLEFHRSTATNTPCTPTSPSTIPWGKFPAGYREAFSASACLIARTRCCRTCWETALCLPTPSPAQFTYTKPGSFCVAAMMGRSIAEGPPAAEAADCSMQSISACLRKKGRTTRKQWEDESFVVVVPTLNFYKFKCTHWEE